MQVTIYDLAYQGKIKEEQALRLADSNTHATLNIARLKSAQSLGDWFSAKNSEVDFVNENNIVTVKTSSGIRNQVRVASVSKMGQDGINLLTRIFSLRSIAEAQPVR